MSERGSSEHVPTTRRRFVDWLLATSFGALLVAVLYPVVRFLSPPETTEAAADQVEAGTTADAVYREAGFRIVRFGAEPVIVVRAGDDDFRAFAATCTHLACIVEYRKEHQDLFCNCHNGKFNLQGEVVAGPPPSPLDRFKVRLVAGGEQGAIIVVTRG